ncbi:MAG: hypothetical protein M0C28_25950 [Candidatus Moduliflexus flocculans]|nr:hypothetical protein [Candidatus Moduliflexus flocculans]
MLADLKKGVIAPCYLLYGEEEYLIHETLQQILDLIIPETDRDFGLFYLDGENTDVDSLIEHILTPSLLGGRKAVVVRNTTIFHSNENLSDLTAKIRNNIDENPFKAVKYFLTFLRLAGFSLEDLKENGWRRITDRQWSKVVAGDAGEDREKWLPRILEICSNTNLVDLGLDKTEQLEKILQNGLASGKLPHFYSGSLLIKKKNIQDSCGTGNCPEFQPGQRRSSAKEVLQKEIQKLLDRYKRNYLLRRG